MTAWELVPGCMLAFYYLCRKGCSPLGSEAQCDWECRVKFSSLGGWSGLRKSRRGLGVHDGNQGGNSAGRQGNREQPGSSPHLRDGARGMGPRARCLGRGQRTQEVWVILRPALRAPPALGLGGRGGSLFPHRSCWEGQTASGPLPESWGPAGSCTAMTTVDLGPVG